MLDQFGITKGKIPAGTYEKAANTKDVMTAVAGSVITVHKEMSEESRVRQRYVDLIVRPQARAVARQRKRLISKQFRWRPGQDSNLRPAA